jgi:hypothetical protein
LYGRTWETLELRDLLIARRAVLLHSPSGAGKTSLIQAGLIPELEKEHFRVLPVVRVGNESKRELEPAGTMNRYVLSVISSLDAALPEDTRPEVVGRTLGEYLERRRKVLSPPDEEPTPEVLIVDQFEEILTLDPTDLTMKETFFAQLGDALRDHHRWVLISMREDYVASIDPYIRLLPNRLSARFRLDFLTPDPARAAMQEPARRGGVALSDAAAAKLVDDLRRVRLQQPDGTMTEQPGPYIEPVQLQVVCKRLWESERASATAITEQDVAAFGNVDNALADYYADEVTAVAKQFDIRERVVREWFETNLITDQGLRGQVLQGVDRTKGLDNRAIARLISTHLVREEKRRGANWFELTHDRLIDPIRRNNAAWRESHLQRFQRLAAIWELQGHPPALLLRGDALKVAERWASTHAEDVTEVERSFLDAASNQHRTFQQEQQRLAALRANLSDLGWGVIFGDDADPKIREALSDLLEHRRRQATGKRDDYYREFIGAHSYRSGESASRFLARNGTGSGPANPEKVPYYLLIVGDPEEIPFQFQYDLAPQYAVGRLHFETLEQYAAYARTVITAETRTAPTPRHAVIFGPRHNMDQATNLTNDTLLKPLADSISELSPPWSVDRLLGPEATKENLRRALASPKAPSLLFSASHGIQFAQTESLQMSHQGALVCQDWPGFGKLSPEYYFSADDVPPDARLLGLIAFFLSACSAGTPQLDDFTSGMGGELRTIAPRPFLAQLPQRLLGLPQGGALAVVGHVERIWTSSLLGEVSEFGIFETTVRRLLGGQTVGASMEILTNRYVLLSSRLAHELRQAMFFKKEQDPAALFKMDIAVIDARNYIVIGDPAVRLPSAFEL